MTEIQQSHNRQEIVHSGKGLGGSTLINGGTWTRPDKAQVDAWSHIFGNKGWTWDELVPYMNQAEGTREPTKKQLNAGMIPIDWSCHGNSGPVQVGPRDTGEDFSPMMAALMRAVAAENVTTQADLSCGHPVGVSMFPNSVTHEPEQWRADAGRSMLQPIVKRPNLKVLVGQDVGKVLFAKGSSPLRAIGVEFGLHQSRTFNVYADHEVLIAAGSSVSPLILQYSGIGVPKVLKAAGIDPLLDLPVGLNQQDQTTTGTRARINKRGSGQGQAAYFATFNETFGPDAEMAYKMLLDEALLESYADKVIEMGGFHDKKALLIQYKNYVKQITQDNVAYSEIFFDTYGRILFDLWNLLPFSRGFIHPANADPYLRDVYNDPKYFQLELDVLGQAAATRLSRKLMSLGPMGDYFEAETTPGYDAVPQNATLADWATWVRANFRANYHSVGTCSMMTRDMGGVVNNKAQVYDTEGLRVVDGSIVPTQVSSHVMSVFYGLALKIAEDVLGDYDNTESHAESSSFWGVKVASELYSRLGMWEL